MLTALRERVHLYFLIAVAYAFCAMMLVLWAVLWVLDIGKADEG